MFKKFLMKAAVGSQIKKLPPAMQGQMQALLDKHPEFFEKINKEVEARVKKGEDKLLASQAVFGSHIAEMRELMSK